MKRIVLLISYLFFISLVWAHKADAAQLQTCGYHEADDFAVENLPVTFPEYSRNEAALAVWNYYMPIYMMRQSDGGVGNNGQNEFCGAMTDAQLYDQWEFHWGPDTAGMCVNEVWWCDCCEVHESDIVINAHLDWTLDSDFFEDNPNFHFYDRTILHELGHSWGYQTKNEDYTYEWPTVMFGHTHDGLVPDRNQIHAVDAKLIRLQYDDQITPPPVIDMGVNSKYADSAHLEWTNSTTDKLWYSAGETMTLNNILVENTGNYDAYHVHIRFYLSPDRYIDPSETLLGDFFWVSFPRESISIGTYSVEIPADVPDGTYYVGAMVTLNGYDGDGLMWDNTTHLYEPINMLSPDLIVENITTDPFNPIPSQNVTVTVTVRNQGGLDAGPYVVDFYTYHTSQPGVYEPGDGTCVKNSGLPVGWTDTCVLSFTYPSAGMWSMWAQVDTADQVMEGNEMNNVLGPVFTPGHLIVSPSGGFGPLGPESGPFEPLSLLYTLKNTGGIPINWTAAKTQPWVNLSATGGTLTGGAGAHVTVSVNSNANSLAPGTYFDTVSFDNTTNSSGNDTRNVVLTVNTPGVLDVTPADGLISSGPQWGPFSPSNRVYTLHNTGGSPIFWTATKTESWVGLSETAGTLAAGAYAYVTVSISTNANFLDPGSYSDSVSFMNTTNGNGNTAKPVSLTVAAVPGNLFVSPSDGFASSGNQGAIFDPPYKWYTLTNTGGSPFSWSATKVEPWITLSASGGTLEFNQSVSVRVSINDNAKSLAPGTYNDIVSFTNTTDGQGNTTRPVGLTVNAAGALMVIPAEGFSSAGYEGGPFSPSVKSYMVQNTGGASISWTAAKTAPWVSLSATGGTLESGASTTVLVSINETANSLSGGSYSDTVIFTNTTNHSGDTTRAVNLGITGLVPGNLFIVQADGLASTGNQGGPFVPPYKSYTLTNTGETEISWEATKTQPWVSLVGGPTSGTLASGENVTIAVSINSTANGLTPGTYNDTVWFTNTTNGNGTAARAVSLTVTAVPVPGNLFVVETDGFTSTGSQGGPFSPPYRDYSVTNPGESSIEWTATRTQPWVTLSQTGGTLTVGAGTNLTVSINSSADSLAPGTYSDTIALTNTTNGNGNTTREVNLCISTGLSDSNCDGMDDDCDGTVDDEYISEPSSCGTGACARNGEIRCQNGALIDTCTQGPPDAEGPFGDVSCDDGVDNDCDGDTDIADADCEAECIPSQEICDGVDNDCNGIIDEGLLTTYYMDQDGDGYGNPRESVEECAQPAGYVTDNTDCIDFDGDIHPGAAEVCNGLDDNCNGTVDEGEGIYYSDDDHDGYGNPYSATWACSQPDGFVIDNTDCIDFDGDIHPGAAEVCNGVDDNCNGTVDEGFDPDGDAIADCFDNCSETPNLGQQDTDSDGYGNACDADLDNNGCVGGNDFNIFKEAWLSSPASPNWNPDADMDSNGAVGGNDFNLFKLQWLKCSPFK